MNTLERNEQADELAKTIEWDVENGMFMWAAKDSKSLGLLFETYEEYNEWRNDYVQKKQKI